MLAMPAALNVLVYIHSFGCMQTRQQGRHIMSDTTPLSQWIMRSLQKIAEVVYAQQVPDFLHEHWCKTQVHTNYMLSPVLKAMYHARPGLPVSQCTGCSWQSKQ